MNLGLNLCLKPSLLILLALNGCALLPTVEIESQQQFEEKLQSDPELYWNVALRKIPQDDKIHFSGGWARVKDKATGEPIGYSGYVKFTRSLPLPILRFDRTPWLFPPRTSGLGTQRSGIATNRSPARSDPKR